MNKPSFHALLLSGFLTLALLGGFVTPVSATSQQSKSGPAHHTSQVVHKLLTFLTFQAPADTNLGEPFTLSGTLKDQYGRPVVNKSILFTIDGEYLGQTRSNENGLFERKFTKVLSAGTYKVKALSNATHALETSASFAELRILPAEVKVQTVPPIAGIPFMMNGTRFVSGQDGIATVNIDTPGQYRLDVLADQYSNPDKRIEFARWLEESYQPYKEINVPTDKVIPVGFNVYHKVGQSFFDLDNLPVDPKRVKEFTIRSAQGDMFVLHDGEPRWIPASRVARRSLGLEETQLLYSVLTVSVDGSNVVNQSQQKFYTYPIEQWPISLLLYSLNFSAKDGLFGSAIGNSVNLQFPDGHVENYPLKSDGTVEIRSLARGNYFVDLVGAQGLSNRTPVALSRNQEVNTKVISYLDIGVIGLAGFLLALGLFLYGRPSVLIILWKRNQKTAYEPEWGLAPEAYGETLAELYDFRHMRYEKVKLLDDQAFQHATGVEREKFEKMLTLLEKEMDQNGIRAKLSGADQILLTLVYFRQHRKEYEIAPVYGVTEGTVRRTIERVKNTLMKSPELDPSTISVLQDANPQKDALVIDAEEPMDEE
jgi:hypothetical protein